MSDQVIRNFELMGRVNLDQLELIKDQGSSCEEEDERDVMEMAENENVARPEDAEEEEEGQEEEREAMESMQEERGMDDEEMEGFGEEAEEQEEEVNEEVAEERHPLQGRPIGNLIIYSIFLLSSTSWNWQFIQNSISQKPSGLPSASQERAAWSGSPASSAAAASPTAWSGNVTSCATACECVCSPLSSFWSFFRSFHKQEEPSVGSVFVEGFQTRASEELLCIHVCTHAHCRSSPSSAGG